MRQILLMIIVAVVISCKSKTSNSNVTAHKVDSFNIEKRRLEANYKSGKGLFMENCAACHFLNKSINGAPFVDIVKLRTVDWAYQLVTDSTLILKDSVGKSLATRIEYHTQFSELTKADIDSIWQFVYKSTGPVY